MVYYQQNSLTKNIRSTKYYVNWSTPQSSLVWTSYQYGTSSMITLAYLNHNFTYLKFIKLTKEKHLILPQKLLCFFLWTYPSNRSTSLFSCPYHYIIPESIMETNNPINMPSQNSAHKRRIHVSDTGIWLFQKYIVSRYEQKFLKNTIYIIAVQQIQIKNIVLGHY